MSEGTAVATDAGAGSAGEAGSGESSGVDLAAFRKGVEAIVSEEADAAPGKQGGATTGTVDDAGQVDKVGADGRGGKPDEAGTGDDAGFKPTERQLDMAKQLGMSDEEVAGLTPGLAAILDRVGTRQSQAMSRVGRLQQQLDAKLKGGAAPAKAATGEDDAAAAEAAGADSGLFVSEDLDSDDGLLGKLNTYANRVQTLEAAMEELRAEKAGKDTETQYDTVDKFFGGLDAEAFPQFGSGAAADLDEESEEYKARDALCSKASDIRAGYALLHDGAEMPLGTAMNEALLIVASDQLKAQAERGIADKVKKRASQRISRPTHQNLRTDTRTAEQRELDAVREGAEKRGIPLARA